VEGSSRHLRRLVVERSNESRDRPFADQTIEEVDTQPPHNGFLVLKTPLDGW
jgi:hypothetical protein